MKPDARFELDAMLKDIAKAENAALPFDGWKEEIKRKAQTAEKGAFEEPVVPAVKPFYRRAMPYVGGVAAAALVVVMLSMPGMGSAGAPSAQDSAPAEMQMEAAEYAGEFAVANEESEMQSPMSAPMSEPMAESAPMSIAEPPMTDGVADLEMSTAPTQEEPEVMAAGEGRSLENGGVDAYTVVVDATMYYISIYGGEGSTDTAEVWMDTFEQRVVDTPHLQTSTETLSGEYLLVSLVDVAQTSPYAVYVVDPISYAVLGFYLED